MRKVRSTSEMSKGVRKGTVRVASADPTRKKFIKRDNPQLGKPVEDDDDLMIKF